MRYSTVPAINLEAHIARSRELIQALPNPVTRGPRWNPERLAYDYCTTPASY